MPLLYACTGNPGKLAEFQAAASPIEVGPFQIAPLPGIEHIAPPDETGATFEDNAVIKALYYSRFTDELVFSDDSGLEVEALGGAPGVHSARFAGVGASDAANRELLLKKLSGMEDRRARFVTAIALAKAGRTLHVAKGQVEGEILRQGCGNNGFGYDRVFFYPPLKRAFAELEGDEKWGVSARGKALRSLLAWLTNQRP